MSYRFAPLTMGSPRAYRAATDSFIMTEAWFPPGLELPLHRHDRTSFAVMLEGSFDLTFPGKSYECNPSTVFTEPMGDRHGNIVGSAGAHVLVLQPDPARGELFEPGRAVLDNAVHFRHGGLTSLAWRIVHELRTADETSPLALHGLAFEMLATATRNVLPASRPPAAWLLRVEEMIRARYRDGLSIEELAREADVHPMHLTRAFRKHYRESIGAFTRRLRLEWTVRQLATSDQPLVDIALAAGFSDQSHFTRAFRRYAGIPPGTYRRLVTG